MAEGVGCPSADLFQNVCLGIIDWEEGCYERIAISLKKRHQSQDHSH